MGDWVVFVHCIEIYCRIVMYELVAKDNQGIYSCRMDWLEQTNNNDEMM